MVFNISLHKSWAERFLLSLLKSSNCFLVVSMLDNAELRLFPILPFFVPNILLSQCG